MTAPTEQEIRDAIRSRLGDAAGYLLSQKDDLRIGLGRVAAEAADPIIGSAEQTLEGGHGVWEPVDDPRPGVLWSDLRPSEAVRLARIVSEAVDRATARCEAVVVDELTSAALRFATEYPDAPRVASGIPDTREEAPTV